MNSLLQFQFLLCHTACTAKPSLSLSNSCRGREGKDLPLCASYPGGDDGPHNYLLTELQDLQSVAYCANNSLVWLQANNFHDSISSFFPKMQTGILTNLQSGKARCNLFSKYIKGCCRSAKSGRSGDSCAQPSAPMEAAEAESGLTVTKGFCRGNPASSGGWGREESVSPFSRGQCCLLDKQESQKISQSLQPIEISLCVLSSLSCLVSLQTGFRGPPMGKNRTV